MTGAPAALDHADQPELLCPRNRAALHDLDRVADMGFSIFVVGVKTAVLAHRLAEFLVTDGVHRFHRDSLCAAVAGDDPLDDAACLRRTDNS
jgi:hypothetical protein